MAELTQKRFAALLRAGLKGMDIKPAEVSRRTEGDGGKAKIDPNTLSEYVKPDYPNGPPKRETRARLERAMELPEGYLDGDVEVNLEQWRKRRRQLRAERDMLGQEAVEHPAESADDWSWVTSDEAEERTRDLLRSIEFHIQGQDLNVSGDKEKTKLGRLIVLRQIAIALGLAGKRLPHWFLRIRSGVNDGTYR